MFRKKPGDPEGLPTSSANYYMPHVPVVAMLGGTVTKSGDLPKGGRVWIDHGIVNGKRLETAYYHLKKRNVTVGDKVKAGDQIGVSGYDPGYPLIHLHFVVLENGTHVDPAPYLAKAQPIQPPFQYGWLIAGGLAVVAGVFASRFI